jgi:alkylated DNA repair dioxygenase AlkB
MYATTEAPRPSSLLRRSGLLPGHRERALVPDGWQASLFGLVDPSIDPAFAGIERIHLDDTSWVDHLPLWLAGADLVFGELVARLPWRHRDVVMYDRVVPEPRLTSWWSESPEGSEDDGAEPLPVLADIRRALSDRYDRHFDSIGCNYYRDGNDSVAWHGDTVRKVYVDPLVAIVSVGSPRPFHLRPRGGGHAHSFELGLGDLLVMGGACQHDWEHSVPKVRHAGPRLSITFRHGDSWDNDRG